jgi:hypothetical protein
MADKVRHLGAKNVKGFALSTHQRLRLWKLQAFEKAWAKLLTVLEKLI